MEEPTHLWQQPRSSALRAFVNSVEYVRNPPPHDREQMVASADCSIVITLDDDGFTFYDPPPNGGGEHRAAGACLVGPQQRPQIVSTRPQRGMLAVNFAPGGALPFFRCPIHATVDGYVDVTEGWGLDGATLRERLLEAETPAAMFVTLERVLLSNAVRPLDQSHLIHDFSELTGVRPSDYHPRSPTDVNHLPW